MDLLNNIWVALSTPNEGLINLISVPSLFIEMYISMQFFITILNISCTKNQKIIYTTLTAILTLISKMIIPAPWNVVVNYIILFICIYKVFRLNLTKTVLAFVCQAFIVAIVASLIIKPFFTIMHLSHQDGETIPIYKILFLAIGYSTIALITFILKRKKIKLVLLDTLDKKTKSVIILSLLLGIFFIIAQLLINFAYIDSIPLSYTSLNFLLFISYFIISVYSLTRVIKLTDTTQKLESAEEYNKTLHILHDNVRSFKHDFDNIVTSIGGYINTNDMEGLKKYYTQLEDDCERVNNLYVFNPDIINNPGIYNLLTAKYHKADQNNIKFNLTSTLDLNNLQIKIYDFARILGILLDNAIEASSECEEKTINLIFRDDTKNNRQLIIIENTYQNKNVNIDDIFKKGISEKENHSGLGLWEVREIINKNNNLNLHTLKDNHYFTQQLEIYYKPSNNSTTSNIPVSSKSTNN